MYQGCFTYLEEQAMSLSVFHYNLLYLHLSLSLSSLNPSLCHLPPFHLSLCLLLSILLSYVPASRHAKKRGILGYQLLVQI